MKNYEKYLYDPGAKEITDILEGEGFCAYLVGGCVRDAIMLKPPCDFDIATSALPENTVEIFSRRGYRVIDTGIRHGTVTVMHNGSQYEITTFRRERGYCDFRHPDAVEFVSEVRQDLARRDFTVNALAYSYSSGSFIDLFGSIDDINNRTIRAVGDARERFFEDPLRILRGLRFASRLGFDIDEETFAAMIEQKDLIRRVSAERICSELTGILCGEYASDILLRCIDIIGVIIGELVGCRGFDQRSRYHSYDVLTHIAKALENTPPVPSLRYAVLFHDIAKPQTFSVGCDGEGHFYSHAKVSADIAERVMTELRADNNLKSEVVFFVRHHDTPLPSDDIGIKKLLSKYGEKRFFALCDIAEADCKAQSEIVRYRVEEIERIREKARAILSQGKCLDLSSLAVSGLDVMSAGVEEGREVGRILRMLLSEVVTNNIDNDRPTLLARIMEIVDKDQ